MKPPTFKTLPWQLGKRQTTIRVKENLVFFFSIATQVWILAIYKRKDKKFLSVMNIISIFDLQVKEDESLPDLSSPNVGLRFVLTDTLDNTLHTEVKSVGPLGGS